jgi:hypothetical protein
MAAPLFLGVAVARTSSACAAAKRGCRCQAKEQCASRCRRRSGRRVVWKAQVGGKLRLTVALTDVSDRELRAAQVAHVLARGVRDGEVIAADALRILRHELRRRNTNKAIKLPLRSKEAQRVIEEYGPTGPPKNGSDDALHADHLWPLTEETLWTTTTVEAWVTELRRLSVVAIVTARENYKLMGAEKQKLWGRKKYEAAGVELIDGVARGRPLRPYRRSPEAFKLWRPCLTSLSWLESQEQRRWRSTEASRWTSEYFIRWRPR